MLRCARGDGQLGVPGVVATPDVVVVGEQHLAVGRHEDGAERLVSDVQSLTGEVDGLAEEAEIVAAEGHPAMMDECWVSGGV